MVEKGKKYLIKLPNEVSWVMAEGWWFDSYGSCFRLPGTDRVFHETVIKEKRYLW